MTRRRPCRCRAGGTNARLCGRSPFRRRRSASAQPCVRPHVQGRGREAERLADTSGGGDAKHAQLWTGRVVAARSHRHVVVATTARGPRHERVSGSVDRRRGGRAILHFSRRLSAMLDTDGLPHRPWRRYALANTLLARARPRSRRLEAFEARSGTPQIRSSRRHERSSAPASCRRPGRNEVSIRRS